MSESVQKWLERNRPPCVKITYDVETGGAIEKRELPFIVGILANLSGDRSDAVAQPCYSQRTMMNIDRDNFNDVMATAQAMVSLDMVQRTLPKESSDDADTLGGVLHFTSLDDFTPLAVARAVPALNRLIEQRAQRVQGGQPSTDIDALLGSQLRAILHARNFQALEATWRGLHGLVVNTETNTLLQLRVFNATQDEVHDDLEKAVAFDQSHLFKLIYEAEFGTYGGLPYSLLVGGYEVGRSAQAISFLQNMAELAAAAHAPFITAASASLFGFDSFRDLPKPRDLSKIFESSDMIGWNVFRNSESSRYVSLVLPHVLLRLPYGKDSGPTEGLDFDELGGDPPSAPRPEHLLWGNAVYALAQRITNAFSHYQWTAAIRGMEGGGRVEGLPLYGYPNEAGAQTLLCPTEVPISDQREKELGDLGFISLCHVKGTGVAAFFNAQTASLPKAYMSDEANANTRLSALLPYMLAACRFAHYIKVIMRNKIGSCLTRGNVEAYLNGWISNYVLLDENASQEAKASYPLSQAKIVVSDIPGSPGAYRAVVFLRPHFQLEELSTSMRLVVHLPT